MREKKVEKKSCIGKMNQENGEGTAKNTAHEHVPLSFSPQQIKRTNKIYGKVDALRF